MTEIEIKQQVADALWYASLYDSLSFWLFLFGFVTFIISFILIIMLSENDAFDFRGEDPDYHSYNTLFKMSALLTVVFFVTGVCIPSENSYLVKAEGLLLQLPDTQPNRVYVTSLSKRYDLFKGQELEIARAENLPNTSVAQVELLPKEMQEVTQKTEKLKEENSKVSEENSPLPL